MNKYEKQIADLSAEGRSIFDEAKGASRELTSAERGRITEIHAKITALNEEKAMAAFGVNLGTAEDHLPHVISGTASPQDMNLLASPGERLVNAPGFKAIANSGNRGRSWSSGPIEVSAGALGTHQFKAGTLLESGQGSGLIPVPEVVPGIVTKLFQPLGVADLFAQATASTSSFRYTVEGTATSGAAGVAEGGAKPASDLTLSTVDEPVKKIATSLITSDELLDDVAGVQAYVNSRLSLFVQNEEERQLLRGSGTNELVGIVNRSGVNTYSKAAGDDNAVALAKSIYNTRGSANLPVDAVIMHPSNYLTMRLLRDGTGGTIGQFYGGGPFTAAYGNAGGITLTGDSIWGVPVLLSTIAGSGTAILGSFQQAAQIRRRGGVTVEATNSHGELFLTDLVAFRAEERLGLAVYRPGAFTVVSGLT